MIEEKVFVAYVGVVDVVAGGEFAEEGARVDCEGMEVELVDDVGGASGEEDAGEDPWEVLLLLGREFIVVVVVGGPREK